MSTIIDHHGTGTEQDNVLRRRYLSQLDKLSNLENKSATKGWILAVYGKQGMRRGDQ